MNSIRQSRQILLKSSPKCSALFSSFVGEARIASTTLSSSRPSPKMIIKNYQLPMINRQSHLPCVQNQRRYFAAGTNNPLSKEHFDMLVSNNKVVVFMKGVPDEPRCGFSNAVVQILRMHGVTDYDSHNVLEDENIRQGIKDYTSWPTIPQVFINGEFVGGCDILLEMHKNGELVQQLSKVGIKSALLDQEGKK